MKAIDKRDFKIISRGSYFWLPKVFTQHFSTTRCAVWLLFASVKTFLLRYSLHDIYHVPDENVLIYVLTLG